MHKSGHDHRSRRQASQGRIYGARRVERCGGRDTRATQKIFPDSDIVGINAPDADYIDKAEAKLDGMGAPGAFQNWERQRQNFMNQIPRHAIKSDFGVVDLAGSSVAQQAEVMTFYNGLSGDIQLRLMIIDGIRIPN